MEILQSSSRSKSRRRWRNETVSEIREILTHSGSIVVVYSIIIILLATNCVNTFCMFMALKFVQLILNACRRGRVDDGCRNREISCAEKYFV